ncbi:Metallo-beta-lactamase superfamily [Phocoenobacter uteri]|uniref:Metallo-beta-lactamase superfamily n=1 Tax=Phocoenobacter uteri TaxID=146806 RepID=A0A379C8Q0_9PAST|nr:MBL fold metallo-hydrolase [Phocoenobacter uteri]MDG6882441.1 hypothetical protein [Phocoenobacter uteri]SUB58601.1 Metallo-beta-lactamase superfamily [Phocoenobacter uteri]
MKNTLKIIVIFITSIFLLTSCSDNKQKFVYPLWEGAKWVDDYYIVGQLDEQTYAISEPKNNWYYNTSYLLLGKDKALLFDTGYGSVANKDIMPVVKKLTDLPVITMYSHFHLDHIANIEKQDNVWIIDLPYLRERAKDNKLTLTTSETLLFDPPTVTVSKWIKPNEIIDLGDRKVQVLNMTGHTTESTVLFDEKYKQLFTGDLFYDPRLDYVDLHDDTKADLLVNSTEKLVATYNDNYVFNGAHGFPKQSYTTLTKYLDFLKAYKNKSLNSETIATSIGFQTIYEKDGMRMATPTYGGSITHQLIINIVFGLLILMLVVIFIRKRMRK